MKAEGTGDSCLPQREKSRKDRKTKGLCAHFCMCVDFCNFVYESCPHQRNDGIVHLFKLSKVEGGVCDH